MKFNLEHGPGNMIHSYAAGEIKIALGRAAESPADRPVLQTISESMILTPALLIRDWIAQDEALAPQHIRQILETQPEIVILGTGARISFPDPALLAQCQQTGVGIEVMDTGAACRTYNVLASEGRKVCAAFMRV
jgi:uncharacterized protein